MARRWKNSVPTFKAGEPGFAEKLNQLADALRETRAALAEKDKADTKEG